ncbi:MAG: SusE domain-containing protein [Bacteroidetes bacterium]|nr:SusE domain-containing protein [Bacteroidota bacterium]
MKLIISKLFFISALALLLGSCKKDEAPQFYKGGTAPVLSASVTGTIPLSYATKDQVGVTFSWLNPEYQFINGVSSQDVAYALEIDKTGNNFGASKLTVSIAKDVFVKYTQDQFNSLIAGLNLTVGTAASIDVRIKASLNGNTATLLTSNTLVFSVTPYNPPPKVAIPAGGVLYLVGSATGGGWGNPVPVPTQQFTKVSTTLYSITVALTGGQEFLFLPLNGDWGHKFACNKTANPPSGETGGVFGYDFSDNFPGPAANGTYKIDVDFQKGIYTVTKQ